MNTRHAHVRHRVRPLHAPVGPRRDIPIHEPPAVQRIPYQANPPANDETPATLIPTVPERWYRTTNAGIATGIAAIIATAAIITQHVGHKTDDSAYQRPEAPFGVGVCLAGTIQDAHTGDVVQDANRGDC